MSRIRCCVAVAALLCGLQPAAAMGQQRPPGSDHEGRAWTFERLADDVYIAIGTGNLTVASNAGIVVNDADVLVVDSHATPAAAASLLRELAEITDKPVRYVVNSHFHWDHAHGNQIYPANVEVIGHEFTRRTIAAGESMNERALGRMRALPGIIEELRTRAAGTADAAERRELERRLRVEENYLAAMQSVRPTPPNLTLLDRMTLFRGGREIRLEFLGRGHTGGDLVVFLPDARVLFTGDLLQLGLPYLGDAFVPDYIETLERLKGLEFDVVIPGHGRPFTDRARIDHLQAYLADFWTQVTRQFRSGASIEDAMARIDLRAHAEHYPQIRAAGMEREPVERAYQLLRLSP